ncbi:MAG: ribonuclease J [Mycoplasma sp.]|nr:ribonuclease J [Mycoplasma sp.]
MKPTRLFALGGMQEIGKTTIVIEYDYEIFIIDAGIKFPESWLSGIDGIIPDYTYLKENQHKIKALLITHAHEDHIGGIPYLLKQVHIKDIYIPKLGIHYLENKFKEHDVQSKHTINEIVLDTVVKSKHMVVDFYTTQHSIPDSFGIRIKTPNGTIVDTGDFRFDYTPIGNKTDFSRMEQIGNEGVDILISDSTNAMLSPHSPTEIDILKDIEKEMTSTEGLFILTTFASNLTRVNAIIELAAKLGKKVFTFGRSMKRGVDIAVKIGYLNVPDGVLIDSKKIDKYDKKDSVLLCTGSQGEEMAALNRISFDKNPKIKIKPGDKIVFSSSPIPGNRIRIEEMINRLYKLGAIIKENKIDGIFHTSGHAYHDEHMKTFELMKPKFFVPYHGELRMSIAHGVTAVEAGVKEENVIIIKNGDVIELVKNVARKTNEEINSGPLYIDSKVISESTVSTIKEREKLGINGFAGVAISINRKDKKIVGRPKIISRGTFYAKENKELLLEIKKLVYGTTLYFINNHNDWKQIDLKKILRERLLNYFYKTKRREPTILTTIYEVN